MNEFDYRIEAFDQHLSRVRGKDIWIYGLGRNAEELIKRYDKYYSFKGVIAPEKTDHGAEDQRWGRPVVTLKEALSLHPDVILIAAQMYSAEQIYQRIHEDCRAHGVQLLDMYGFDQIRLHDEIASHCYQDLPGWEELTESYDVVSFALTDTVLIRDMFHDRPPRMRPVFKNLLGTLRNRGTILIGLEEAGYPHQWYEGAFYAEGFDSTLFDRICVREHTQGFFRALKEQYPGKKVLHIGESDLSDVIIPRLCGWDSYKMVFFDRAGLTAFEQQDDCHISEEHTETKWSEQDVRQIISNCDGVVCDVFDTLLMRRTLEPQDVFYLTALSAYDQGILFEREQIQRFAQVRSEEQVRHGTLHEIYEGVAECLGLDRMTSDLLAQLEIDTERKVLVPRRSVADMLVYARNCGKKVVLVSDMYLPSAVIRAFLDENGIHGYDDIVVSGERGLSKPEGLFALVKKEYFGDAGQIVQIGDDPAADKYSADRAGFTSVLVPTPYGRRDILDTGSEAENTVERLLYGMILAEKYADPGRPEGSRQDALYDYGFCSLAPAIIGWTVWFLQQLQSQSVEKVLFAARDGYLFRESYDRLKPYGFPESVYYYTSRRAAFSACSDREEMTGYMTSANPELSAEAVLSCYYDIPAEQQKKGGTTEERIRANTETIRRYADAARACQQDYWREIGLQKKAEYAFFDFMSSGTTQRMIEETAEFRLKGYYFGRNEINAQIVEMKSFLSNEGRHEKRFIDRYMEMEYYLLSPEPSVRRYGLNGEPVFAEEVRDQNELRDLEIVHQGVRDFVERFADICSGREILLAGADISPDFVCRLYLEGAHHLPRRKYYDDWSKQWLN